MVHNTESIDWPGAANYLITCEESLYFRNDPKPTFLLLKWRNQTYLGSIQYVPHDSNEIVVLSKSNKPLPEQFIDALRMLQPDRLELIADDFMDLDGQLHVTRRTGNRITQMTPEQTMYMIAHPISITPISPGPG